MISDRRDFLKLSAATLATAGCASVPTSYTDESESEEGAITAKKFKGLKVLPSVMPNAVVKESKVVGKGKIACKYVDDTIWFLRDLARQRPKSIFDHPFLASFKRIHEATGLKVQFNLFYRTDYFYGMDEFTLADMPDCYKAEFQANRDWIKFGFHALQEFPDYPWLNADYSDVEKCLKMIRSNVARFAGENIFAKALIPHWVPMSKDGIRALKDGGIKLVYATFGNRYEYNGDESTIPYGHNFRLLNNRKPETALYTRAFSRLDLAASLCGYNHIDAKIAEQVRGTGKIVYDPDSEMNYLDFCTRPMTCINIPNLKKLQDHLDAVKDCPFVGYGNHEQYFFKDYMFYQPDYMAKEMLAAKTLADRGYKFIFMEDII